MKKWDGTVTLTHDPHGAERETVHVKVLGRDRKQAERRAQRIAHVGWRGIILHTAVWEAA